MKIHNAAAIRNATEVMTNARPKPLCCAIDPTTNGDSIAHWDGDTLVVDTTQFEPKHGVTLIPGGGFRTATSHLVERYRLLKNGSMLSVTFTWTDPAVYAAPHSYEFRYQRAEPKYEARPYGRCDPFDAERTAFLEGTR